jgi:hypothetical protein
VRDQVSHPNSTTGATCSVHLYVIFLIVLHWLYVCGLFICAYCKKEMIWALLKTWRWIRWSQWILWIKARTVLSCFSWLWHREGNGKTHVMLSLSPGSLVRTSPSVPVCLRVILKTCNSQSWYLYSSLALLRNLSEQILFCPVLSSNAIKDRMIHMYIACSEV